LKKAKLSERLEIRLEPEQLEKLKKDARDRNVSVGEIVREAITQKYDTATAGKIAAAKDLAMIGAPVKEWQEMKKEIEAGRTDESIY
jgi:hypothetical protein